MSDRREFLKETSIFAGVAPFFTGKFRVWPNTIAASLAGAGGEQPIQQGFKAHWLKQGDGNGGWVLRPAEIQYLHWGDGAVPYDKVKGDGVKPFGLAQMDNGEVILAGSWDSGDPPEKPIVAFSRDRGRTWSKFERIADGEGRPVVLTYLGKGNLVFQTDTYSTKQFMQYFSSDFGRTWPKRRPLQYPPQVELYYTEGNALVDRDAHGNATRIAQAGGSFERGKPWPAPSLGTLRWSHDGGHTWANQIVPEWQWDVEYQGKTYTHSVNEGSLVRASNGWIVAALRTNCDPPFFGLKNDNLEGIAVSVSKQDGKTWTPLRDRRLYAAGRMHTHLIVMPDGDIVMTYILRQDIENGRLASFRRGCEAVVSHDHGLTWDLSHKYILDDFEFSDGTPYALASGHLFSTLLDDGFILTAYANYPCKGAVLIRWKPAPR